MSLLNTERDLERKGALKNVNKTGWGIEFTLDTYKAIIADLKAAGTGGGGPESDPIFLASAAANVIDTGLATNFLAADGNYYPIAGGGGGEDLAATLALGNLTGANNILMTSGQEVTNATDTTALALEPTYWEIVKKDGASRYAESWVYGDANVSELGYGNVYLFEANSQGTFMKGTFGDYFYANNSRSGVADPSFLAADISSLQIFDNTGGVTVLEPGEGISVALNSAGIFNTEVDGAVAISLPGTVTAPIKTDHAAYMQKIVLVDNGLSTNQLVLQTESLFGFSDYAQTFQKASGTIALLTDIPAPSITNISEGPTTTTTVRVDSSDGSNATLLAASSIRAGVMTSGKFDEVAANTLKVSADGSVATHSDVTSDQASALVGTTPDAPTAVNPYATKLYVDAIAAGVTPKAAVDLATSVADGNITLSGEQTIDGILTSSSRVLVKSQTLPAENGIYDTSAGAWTRATDFDDSPAGEIQVGSYAFVLDGTENNKTGWMVDVYLGTIDTDPIQFVQFQGLPSNHAATHIEGGVDEIDGDLLKVDFTPTNYTPTAQTGTVDALDAHLKGLDDALLGAGGDGNGLLDGGTTSVIPAGTETTVTDSLTFKDGQVVIAPAADLLPTEDQTIDWNTSNNQTIDFTNHIDNTCTISFNNPVAGAIYTIKFVTVQSTPISLLWPNAPGPGAVLWEGEGAKLSTTTSANVDNIDLVTLYFDGTNYLASYGTNYK